MNMVQARPAQRLDDIHLVVWSQHQMPQWVVRIVQGPASLTVPMTVHYK